jgi:hypothetical protein
MFSWSAKVGAAAFMGTALNQNKIAMIKTRIETCAAFIALNFHG